MAEHVQRWLPLGNAQLIDWKQLERPSSAPGATAWVTSLAGESLILRTWCKESTTYFEFFFLARPKLSGSVVVAAERPEHTRLRLRVTVEVEGLLSYSEESEFLEHPVTALYARVARRVELSEGQLQAERLPDALCAEVFEYAPESALQTAAGEWLRCLFVDMLRGLEAGPGEAAAASFIPTPSIADPIPSPHAIAAPRGGSERRPSIPSSPLRVTPSPATPADEPAGLPPMTISTNSGEQWEVTEDETYIGRSKQCTIVLKSQRVSRKHASITREADGYFINDLGAANGIWAGTEKINRERIESGAEYIIGDVLLSFEF